MTVVLVVIAVVAVVVLVVAAASIHILKQRAGGEVPAGPGR